MVPQNNSDYGRARLLHLNSNILDTAETDTSFYFPPYLLVPGGDGTASHAPAFISHNCLYCKQL